jgi:tRNA(Ile)-lysidine synthase
VLERVLKTISRYNMLAPGARVAVAVSGGADSVCLLHVLRELAPQLKATLTGVAHFNHKLRGEDAEEDERFVAAMAANLALPFYRAEAQVSAARGNLEQAARRARNGFLARLIQDGITDCVALGHTRDDQAETVLFRLLRGSGLAGLAGIYPRTPEGFVGPLIDATRAQVETFLRSRGIPWREDSTNREPRFARNRLRHDLLPQLAREWNPQIAAALAHLADLAQEEQQWWKGELDRLAPNLLANTLPNNGVEVSVAALAALPRAPARRMVRRAISMAKGDLRQIDYDHVERIVEMPSRGVRRLSLPGIEAIRSFDWIRLAPPGLRPSIDPVPVAIPGTYPAPDRVTEIRVEFAQQPQQQRCPHGCANLRVELSWGQVPGPIELRGWRPGDHYRPAGQSRDQKVKDLFQKHRIPSWRRPFWPILTSRDKILWVRKFGAAEEFAAGDKASPVLRIVEADHVIR